MLFRLVLDFYYRAASKSRGASWLGAIAITESTQDIFLVLRKVDGDEMMSVSAATSREGPKVLLPLPLLYSQP